MKYGFVIDQRKCIGCHACTVACKSEHDVPIGVYRTWVKYVEKGEFPNTRRHFLVNRCNHCDDAPCVTICPTTALFKRDDGIVDFDSTRCIGCKSCMQACPYDSIYIDPRVNTAAKCNYCVHRVDVGLQPACVTVCPTQAIVSGDLQDTGSFIAQLVGRENVRVRRPEQGTGPNVYYIGADEAAINPEAAPQQDIMMWRSPGRHKGMRTPSLSEHNATGFRAEHQGVARKVHPAAPEKTVEYADRPIDGSQDRRTYKGSLKVAYDTSKETPWGWMVSAYLGTKSIGAGAFLLTALALGFGLAAAPANRLLFAFIAPILALVFSGVTLLLLVADLKRPERFWYLLLKGNPTSWLVWGGWILQFYCLALVIWLGAALFGFTGLAGGVLWPGALLALAAAGYTAFLFGQAEGRDFWQSPLLLPHLLVQAFLGGAATLGLIATLAGANAHAHTMLAIVLAVALASNLIMFGSELLVPHVNTHVAAAGHLITHGAFRGRFWGGAVLGGNLVPLALLGLALALPGLALALLPVAGLLALVGLFLYEDLFVKAGQAVPIS